MEDQPSIVEKLTLREMILRKLVVFFWNQTDIFALILEFYRRRTVFTRVLWQDIEAKVRDKISKLDCPESLKREMKLMARPIGLRIHEWKKLMQYFSRPSIRSGPFSHLLPEEEHLSMHILKQLCWTSVGVIDYAQTVENLVSSHFRPSESFSLDWPLETLHPVKLFKIACGHCLADSLPLIWKELPADYKRSVFEADPNAMHWYLYTSEGINDLLPYYWAYVLIGEEFKLLQGNTDFHLLACVSSALFRNKAAAEYFLPKLTHEERRTFFSKFSEILGLYPHWTTQEPLSVPREECPDVLCYFFSQMTPEEEMEVLRQHPGWLFRVFLRWPWQDLFLAKADLVWSFPPEESKYDELLLHIKMKFEHSDYYFPDLFHEFFRRSPSDFKKHFVNREWASAALFCRLLHAEDKKTIKVILRNIEDEDRAIILSYFDVFRMLDCSLLVEDQHLVEFCIREAYPSVEDRSRLRKFYMEFLPEDETELNLRRKENWQIFFASLDKSDYISALKRYWNSVLTSRKIRL